MLGPLQDFRADLAKLRRPVLSAILKHNNVPHTPDDPATVMRSLIEAKNIPYQNFDYDKYLQGRLETPKEVEKEEAVIVLPGTKLIPDYTKMPMWELKQVAKEAGIVTQRTDKKSDIIEKLSGKNIT
jgi:hypothetical protein